MVRSCPRPIIDFWHLSNVVYSDRIMEALFKVDGFTYIGIIVQYQGVIRVLRHDHPDSGLIAFISRVIFSLHG